MNQIRRVLRRCAAVLRDLITTDETELEEAEEDRLYSRATRALEDAERVLGESFEFTENESEDDARPQT
jgi:hypothetical protein